MMSVLVLTFTVSSGFVSNGYHKAYARGNLDALGTKIRESINNQITEELYGSAGPNPSSGSSGLTTTSPSSSPRLSYNPINPCGEGAKSLLNLIGTYAGGHAIHLRATLHCDSETRIGIVVGATITFSGDVPSNLALITTSGGRVVTTLHNVSPGNHTIEVRFAGITGGESARSPSGEVLYTYPLPAATDKVTVYVPG